MACRTGAMNVEPAPLRTTFTVGLTVAVEVAVETESDVVVAVDVEVTVLAVVDVETEVLVTVDVTVEALLPEDMTAYAPPATTRATTITMAATAPVPIALL
jgi:hypothetical protein